MSRPGYSWNSWLDEVLAEAYPSGGMPKVRDALAKRGLAVNQRGVGCSESGIDEKILHKRLRRMRDRTGVAKQGYQGPWAGNPKWKIKPTQEAPREVRSGQKTPQKIRYNTAVCHDPTPGEIQAMCAQIRAERYRL